MTAERFTYFPGCSAKGLGRAYEESLLAVFEHLGAGLEELEDWNCCGATAWPSVDDEQAIALGARNLALAEDRGEPGALVDLVAACAGCYRALVHAERALADGGPTATKVRRALAAIGLDHEGRVRARHPVDVLLHDIGLERIRAAVVRPLTGVRVASYYGCLLVRPSATFDDPWNPTSMDRLVEAVGAEPVDWPLKTRCCGGSCYCGGPVIGVMPEATLQLSHALLREAARRGADLVVTVCPLCQFNLEGFQERMTRRFGHPHDLPVAFLTQLLGIAFGIDERRLGIHRLLRWRLPEGEAVAAGATARGGGDAHRA